MDPAELLPPALGVAGLGLLLKATLILGAAWLVAAAARRSSAAVRHGVWVMALLATVSLPVGEAWLPRIEVDLPRVLEALPSLRPTPARPLLPADSPGSAVSAVTGTHSAAATAAGPSLSRGRPGSAEASAGEWGLLLLAVWAAGFLGRGLWLGVQLWRVRRMVAGASPIDGARAAAAAAAARLIGVRRPALLFESDRITTPVTCGVRRPVILLPAASAAWPEGLLRVVLQHELAHIRRRDYLASLLAEVAAALYWPVPLVWLARAAVHAEQELASDDLVLASGTPAVEYADHLLSVARSLRPGASRLAATIGMAREAGLKRRIRTILDRGTRRAPLASLPGALSLAALALFALPLAALGPAATPDEPVAPLALTPPARPAETSRKTSAPAHLWFEAEAAALTGNAVLGDDLDASQGHYLWLDEGGEAQLPLPLPGERGAALWARVRPVGDASLVVAVNDGAWARVAEASGASGEDGWRWIALPAGADPVGAGAVDGDSSAILRLAARDGRVRVDRILVTSAPGFVPTDRGAQPEGFAPVHRWIDVAAGPLAERAEFAVDLPIGGRYVLWGRVMGADDGANSLFLSVDGGKPVIWDAPRRELRGQEGRWMWDPASARELGGRGVNPLVLELTAGRHRLQVAPREPGTGLAGLLLTNDLTFRPRGRTPGSPAVQLWLEAEAAQPTEALRPRVGDGATGEGYLQAAGRDRGRSDPEDHPAAELRFQLESAGVYTLWGRALARRDSEDSFWIRINGSRWLRWNGIPRGDDWQWSTVHDGDGPDEGPLQIALPAGENRIEIARREGGARLDRLFLTNDDNFDPRGIGTE